MERKITNMSISLPVELKEMVKRRVQEDRYGTPSDYLRSLIREDICRCDQERLEQALIKSLDSGKGVVYGAKEWDAFKGGVIKNIVKKKR